MLRFAPHATLAAYALLAGSALSWAWLATHPGSLPREVPVVLVTACLAAAAVGLILCRRANLIALFLANLACAITGAWLLARMWRALGVAAEIFLVR
jgi:hypothetical protein